MFDPKALQKSAILGVLAWTSLSHLGDKSEWGVWSSCSGANYGAALDAFNINNNYNN